MNKTNTMVKNALGSLFYYIYLDQLDHDKYGSIIQNMGYQKLLGNDHYPRTIFETNNVLSNHKFNINKNKKNIISIQNQTRTSRINRTGIPLHYCLRKWK